MARTRNGSRLKTSDSRLSSGQYSSQTGLTDAAARVLPLPIIFRRQTSMGLLGTPILSSNLAFAHAGSSLIALQAYTAVLPLGSNLQTSGSS